MIYLICGAPKGNSPDYKTYSSLSGMDIQPRSGCCIIACSSFGLQMSPHLTTTFIKVEHINAISNNLNMNVYCFYIHDVIFRFVESPECETMSMSYSITLRIYGGKWNTFSSGTSMFMCDQIMSPVLWPRNSRWETTRGNFNGVANLYFS